MVLRHASTRKKNIDRLAASLRDASHARRSRYRTHRWCDLRGPAEPSSSLRSRISLETATKHKKGCIFRLFVRLTLTSPNIGQDRSILMNHAMTESASRCSLRISSASFGSVVQHAINAGPADPKT